MSIETEQEEKCIRERWFPNHVARFTQQDCYSTLSWRNPNNSNYFCAYIINHNMLFVYGDVGEAIYGWGQAVTWEWIAGLDLGYFAGKCCASETGRLYKSWDPRRARNRFSEFLGDSHRARIKYRALDEFEMPVFSSQGEWNLWLSQHGSSVIGDCYYEMGDIGECINIRCHGHLLGIKMAVAMNNKLVDTD